MTSFWKNGPLRSGIAVAALVAATPAMAQDAPTQAELIELVRAQAAEIASLRARVDRLEADDADDAAGSLPLAAAPRAAPPIEVAQASRSADAVTPPFAPQIVPPGPAERDVARVQAANLAGVTTEWGAGLPVFHSADGVFSFKPRGRILADVSTSFGSGFDGRNITTTGMRALRLGLEGTVGTHFFYQLEADFSEDQVEMVTAYMGWRAKLSDDADFDLRLGHLFNDRSFDGSTGSDSTPFLERTTVATAILPQRGFYGLGIMPRLFWDGGHASLTVTGDRIEGEQDVSDSRTVLGRVHLMPVRGDRGVLHVGLWGFDEHLADGADSLTRNTGIGGRFNQALRISTGPLIGGTGTTGYGAELGGYLGPVWLMGEAGQRHARLDGGRPDFVTEAWSVSGGWFVTGDLPPYNPRLGSFGQPRVLRPVFSGGPGAIELTARYENLDFQDIATGGQGWAATMGANWYLNSFTRIQLNAIHWHTDNLAGPYIGSDDGQTVSTRFAVTF